MNAKQAVAQRILELCKSRSITVNTLANDAGIPVFTTAETPTGGDIVCGHSANNDLQHSQHQEQESGNRDDQAGM